MSDSLEIPRALVAEAVATSLSRWLPAGTPLVAAVSGGADSVALAWALALQHERWPLTAVLFVDHGLRDVSAERDAAKAAAEAAHTRFIEARVTLAPGNVQASARRARYQALIATARQLDERTRVATGHTSSDQAETVLARLARGAGLPGLAGLAPCRGRLVRPLLAVSRRATRALGLPFVDDPSNASPRFQRNRLRALLEQLGDERDAVEAGLALLADTARSSTRILDALALSLPGVDLSGLDVETTQTLLVHLARAHGARGPERRAMRAWAAALSAGRADAVSLGEGLRGIARGGHASLVPDEDPRRVVVARQPGTYRGPAMELTITESDNESDASLPEGEALVPADALVWPLKLEPARRDESGVHGEEVDLVSGALVGGWRVSDGSGRTLVPSGHGNGAVDRAAGSLQTAGANGWFRIVLKPLKHARDTRVVGSSKGPLHR